MSSCLAALLIVVTSAAVFAKESAAPVQLGNLTGLQIHFQAEAITNQVLGLRGADARQQLLVTAKFSSGGQSDFTRQVTYETSPAGIVQVEKSGLLTPLADGKTIVTAKSAEGAVATLPVTVEKFKTVEPINFPNQIVPIFTKNGCNGGGCHGKSSGQNGFKLSLLGFEPTEDYEHLVKEARGRRLFPASPTRSLLLMKGAASLPHGGGKRLDPVSDDYKFLVRWIAQGMPYGKTNDPTVARIEVIPKERTMQLGGEQQLVVLAHYTDGSIHDVTRGALFEPNDKDLAKTSETGRITVFDKPGDVAVMVRTRRNLRFFAPPFRWARPWRNCLSPKHSSMNSSSRN